MESMRRSFSNGSTKLHVELRWRNVRPIRIFMHYEELCSFAWGISETWLIIEYHIKYISAHHAIQLESAYDQQSNWGSLEFIYELRDQFCWRLQVLNHIQRIDVILIAHFSAVGVFFFLLLQYFVSSWRSHTSCPQCHSYHVRQKLVT